MQSARVDCWKLSVHQTILKGLMGGILQFHIV